MPGGTSFSGDSITDSVLSISHFYRRVPLRHWQRRREGIHSHSGIGVGRYPSFRLARLAAIFLSGSPGMANGTASVPSRVRHEANLQRLAPVAFALLLTLAAIALTFPDRSG